MLVTRSAPAAIDLDQNNFITAEFSRVCQDPVDGIYICPLANNFLEWRGFIMVRAGCYSGGTFRFTMMLPVGFPQSIQLPVVVFDSLVYHPYVDPSTYELCLHGCFPGGIWRRDQHKILDVLHYLQEVFAILTEKFPLDTKPIVNKQAASLFTRDFDNFCLRAEEIVAMSRHTVYDFPSDCSDPHLIVFPPYESSKMEPIRRKLLGKTGAPTNVTDSTSRTMSDFSSHATSNGGDADDENGGHASGGSEHSFEEIHLDIGDIGRNLENDRRQKEKDYPDEFSSVDLNSAPPSTRHEEQIIEEPEDGEEESGFDWLNDNNETVIENHVVLSENNNESDDDFRPSISFKIGCGSSSSGPEEESIKILTDSMHHKRLLETAVSIEGIADVNDSLDEQEQEIAEERDSGVKNGQVRSVAVFNDGL